MRVTARIRPPGRTVELDDVTTVAALLRALDLRPQTVLVLRDGMLVIESEPLRDGDEVEVRHAISGGAR